MLALAGRASAQSDDQPLGDLARQLRKTQPPPQKIIDNDNLSDVMEEGESRGWSAMSVRFSLDQMSMQIVNASSPDVTCALSFSAKGNSTPADAKPQLLPRPELAKLDGPAAIVGDELQLAVYNGSAWDLREITVGLTLVRKSASVSAAIGGGKLVQAAINEPVTTEKRSDVTMLYHLKGVAAPFTTTQFREALNTMPGPDQEWHWAIVEAKGIPPPAVSGN